MNYILFDDYSRFNLLPLTYTKPVCELRIGILTIRDKWEKYLGASPSFHTQDYLSTRFPKKESDDNIFINGKISPTDALLSLIKGLEPGACIKRGNDLLAYRTNNAGDFNAEALLLKAEEKEVEYISINDPYR